MAYIGKQPAIGNFVKLDAISTSSTNTYNLTVDSVAFVPESANHMLVSLNGVIQAPLTSFSVSGSTITFLPSSGTLSSSDSIDFIMVYGNVLDIGTPSDSTVTNAKTNFVSTSSSAGLQIKGDNTTAGTLQLNCEQNSHGIKLRSPAHSTSSSYTLTFPGTDPSADKFLKTDGSGNLSFADAGGGAFEKLVTTNITSGAVTNVTFDNTYITSTYRDYRIICSNFEVSADSYLYMRISDDNGSNFKSANNYKYASRSYKSDSTTNSQGSNGTGEFRMTADTMKDGGSPSDHTSSIIIDIFDPLNTNTCFSASWRGFFTSASSLACGLYGGGFYDGSASSSFNAIKLFLNSGNLELGSYTLYGRKI